MKATKTWILIADGARARVLLHDGPGRGLHAVDGLVFSSDHSATHDLVSDREGRSFSSVGPGRSKMEAQTDPHRDLKTKFAHRLADAMATALQDGAYDRLVIVASPVTLGDLRAAVSDHVRAKIVAEIDRDLTKVPNGEIAQHLNSVLNV